MSNPFEPGSKSYNCWKLCHKQIYEEMNEMIGDVALNKGDRLSGVTAVGILIVSELRKISIQLSDLRKG